MADKTTKQVKTSTPSGDVPQAPVQEVQPQIQLKGQRKLQHHLFESDVRDCKKNVSYMPKQPRLEPMPHKHFFHTIDNRGRKLHVSSMSNGHYHDVTWKMNPATGVMEAEAGPAKKLATRRYEDGTSETVPEDVQWQDVKGNIFKDDHKHVWTYIDTEEFTASSLDARREQNRADMAKMGVNMNPTVKAMQTPVPITEADGVTIRES